MSSYIIYNPVGNMDLNNDQAAVPQAATGTHLHIHGLVVLLGFLQKLFEAAGRHVFGDEDDLEERILFVHILWIMKREDGKRREKLNLKHTLA